MANRYAVANGNFGDTSTWSDSPAGASGASVPVAGDFAYANNYTVTIAANASCAKISNQKENGATVGGTFTMSAGVTLTADVMAGSAGTSCLGGTMGASDSCTIIGNFYGGTATNAHAANIGGTGTVNITGNLHGGTVASAYGVNITSALNVNVTGSLNPRGTGVSAIYASSGVLANISITGNIYGGSNSNYASLYYLGSGTVTIVGNLIPRNSGTVFSLGGSNNTVNITGSVYSQTTWGSTVLSIYPTNGTLTLTGAAYGGGNGDTVNNTGSGSIFKAIRIIGSNFGSGSPADFDQGYNYALITNNTAYSYIEEIQFGTRGMVPCTGPVILTDKTSNVAIFRKTDYTTKTLIDSTMTAGAVPSASNVRSGVVFNSGASTGTCAVPAASSVAYGIPVDNTTGTAVLSQAACWNQLTSTMTVAGSVGERIKDASTVATAGQQISNALSS